MPAVVSDNKKFEYSSIDTIDTSRWILSTADVESSATLLLHMKYSCNGTTMVSSKMLYGHNYSLYKPVQSLPQSSTSVNASHAVLHVARRFLLHLLGLSIPCPTLLNIAEH